MAKNTDLDQFVRDALITGASRDAIRNALLQAGWSPSEVSDALNAWSETSFSPPIPRPQSIVSARDFFIYALTFGVLLMGASHLVVLFHALIDQMFQDTGPFYGASRTIRWSMSVLIVMVPLYLWMTIKDRRKLVDDPSLYRSAIRKWMIYLTLLSAAAVLLSDLVWTLNAFLNGDLGGQFLAKAAIVAVVAGGVFSFYLTDVRRGEKE